LNENEKPKPRHAGIEDAILIAVKAHFGQVDKQGVPYILHPLRVMFAMETDEERIVAVLHDVVEDTPTTLGYLHDCNFSPEVIAAIDALTQREGEVYTDFTLRAKADPLARLVKTADIQDNVNRLTPELAGMRERYTRALLTLLAAPPVVEPDARD
jgi:(p)ppGpp synthase/HD superfamily hydrolase